jgi:hypothetical protein
MAQAPIGCRILMSVAWLLGLTGCPPEPPDDADAGIGGSATGGRAATGGTPSGGSATGGTAPVPACSTVQSLPAMGASCSTFGESQCDASGNQCVCIRGIWNCTTSCSSTYPAPAPGSPCIPGAACNYPSGVSCACWNVPDLGSGGGPYNGWICAGGSGCPADLPATGSACDGLANTQCEYPSSDPASHYACLCSPNADASTGTWVCYYTGPCPATQPTYDLSRPCSALAYCSYDSTRCTCLDSAPWICGLAVFPFQY